MKLLSGEPAEIAGREGNRHRDQTDAAGVRRNFFRRGRGTVRRAVAGRRMAVSSRSSSKPRAVREQTTTSKVPTMRDVADAAGVSTATVSNVLRGLRFVAPQKPPPLLPTIPTPH